MSTPIIRTSFAAGELTGALAGRVDLAKYSVGAAVMRNFFVDYRGGATTRAGTSFIGHCRYNAELPRPRLLEFKYSDAQTYVLELGSQFMRVIRDGGYLGQMDGINGMGPDTDGTLLISVNGTLTYQVGQTIEISQLPVGVLRANGLPAMLNRQFTIISVGGHYLKVAQLSLAGMTQVLWDNTWTPYQSGGAITRLIEVAIPWGDDDLFALRFDQSADVMTVTHVNYPRYNINRFGDLDWRIAQEISGSVIPAPSTSLKIVSTDPRPAGSAPQTTVDYVDAQGVHHVEIKGTYPDPSETNTENPVYPVYTFSYLVSSVDGNGQESLTSILIRNDNSALNQDDAVVNTLSWDPVPGADHYRIYKAEPEPQTSAGTGPFVMGLVGTAIQPLFVDVNYAADYTQGAPTIRDPFSNTGIAAAVVNAGGAGYTNPSVTITDPKGGGAIVQLVVKDGAITQAAVLSHGTGYVSPTATITGSTGAGAAIGLTLGGTDNPGCVAYHEQRKWYAGSNQNPATLWASKPGQFTNFNVSNPTTDSDAITATLATQDINQITALISATGGLIALTASGAYLITGSGTGAITPSTVTAKRQVFSGSSPVQPILVQDDILFNQARGSAVRSLSFNFFTSSFSGQDISVLSGHLLEGHYITQWAMAEEPFKLLWAVRDDGVLLSLTYMKEQQVYGWARHDTAGKVISVASIPEGREDAVYLCVLRYTPGLGYKYCTERLASRLVGGDVARNIATNAERAWCVDAGVARSLNYPSNSIVSIAALPGGQYTVTLSGATLHGQEVGWTLRVDGGRGVVTGVASPAVMIVQFDTLPALLPNLPVADGLALYGPIPSGSWTLDAPVSTVAGLDHLNGATVQIVGDGEYLGSAVVADGCVTLPSPASSILIGQGFTAQLQTMRLEPPQGMTLQGQRKQFPVITVRAKDTKGVKVGPQWDDMIDMDQLYSGTGAMQLPGSLLTDPDMPSLPSAFTPPAYVDDVLNLPNRWNREGIVCMEQSLPLPATILAVVPEVVPGDTATRSQQG